MADAVEKFNPESLMQGVRDRIKATFVSLIPDEQWEQMVRREIDAFFKNERDYNARREVSNFSLTVSDVLRKEAEEKIKVLLGSPEYKVNWSGDNKMELPEFFRGEIMKRAPEIFAAMVEQSLAVAINQMRNR